MKGVTLIINGQDFSPDLSTYDCNEIYDSDDIVETMDHRRHIVGSYTRDQIVFSLIPTREEYTANYDALKKRPLIVEYSKAHCGIKSGEFGMTGNIESKFLIYSFGHARYRGGNITLECLDAEEVLENA